MKRFYRSLLKFSVAPLAVALLLVSVASCSNSDRPADPLCVAVDPSLPKFDCAWRGFKNDKPIIEWWSGRLLGVPAANQDSAVGVATSVVRERSYVPIWVTCKPYAVFGKDELEAAYGSCVTCLSGSDACSICAASAAMNACIGKESICTSDSTCSACLNCLDNGGVVTTCACSGAYAQNLASCLAEQCATACGEAPSGPVCEYSEVNCTTGGCSCDDAGVPCSNFVPEACCSNTCTAEGVCGP